MAKTIYRNLKHHLEIEHGQRLSYFDLMALLGTAVLHPGGLSSTLELISKCEITGDKKVLDIGCGSGTTAMLLARTIRCFTVGLDINANMIANANISAQKLGLDTHTLFVRSDSHYLPFSSQTFDVIICEGALSFMTQKSQVVAEITRVMCSEGKIGSIEFYYPKHPSQTLLQRVSAAVNCAIQPMSRSDWQDLFQSHGLRLAESRDYPVDLVQPRMTNAHAEVIEARLREFAPNLARAQYQEICVYILNRLQQYQEVFNANRRHLRYRVFIWDKMKV